MKEDALTIKELRDACREWERLYNELAIKNVKESKRYEAKISSLRNELNTWKQRAGDLW